MYENVSSDNLWCVPHQILCLFSAANVFDIKEFSRKSCGKHINLLGIDGSIPYHPSLMFPFFTLKVLVLQCNCSEPFGSTAQSTCICNIFTNHKAFAAKTSQYSSLGRWRLHSGQVQPDGLERAGPSLSPSTGHDTRPWTRRWTWRQPKRPRGTGSRDALRSNPCQIHTHKQGPSSNGEWDCLLCSKELV